MRTWLYNKNAEPKIFTGEEAIKKALADGWVETPAAFKKDTLDAKVIEKGILGANGGYESKTRDELFQLAKEKGLKVPNNIGRVKLLEKLTK